MHNMKGPISDFKSVKKEELTSHFIELINKKFNVENVIDTAWHTDKLFTIEFTSTINNRNIGNYDFLYLGKSNYYIFLCSAYNGLDGRFVQYVCIFDEILYSIRFENENVI